MLRRRLTTTLKLGAAASCTALVGMAVYQGIEVRNGYKNSTKIIPPDGPVFGIERSQLPPHVDKMVQSSISLILKSKEKVALLNEKILELNKELKG